MNERNGWICCRKYGRADKFLILYICGGLRVSRHNASNCFDNIWCDHIHPFKMQFAYLRMKFVFEMHLQMRCICQKTNFISEKTNFICEEKMHAEKDEIRSKKDDFFSQKTNLASKRNYSLRVETNLFVKGRISLTIIYIALNITINIFIRSTTSGVCLFCTNSKYNFCTNSKYNIL